MQSSKFGVNSGGTVLLYTLAEDHKLLKWSYLCCPVMTPFRNTSIANADAQNLLMTVTTNDYPGLGCKYGSVLTLSSSLQLSFLCVCGDNI